MLARTTLATGSIALLLASAGLAAPSSAPSAVASEAPAATDRRLLSQLNREMIAVTRTVTAAVVNISSTKVLRSAEGGAYSPMLEDPIFRQLFGDYFRQIPREIKEQSLGTGFIVDPSGIVVTNNHVIEKATAVKVQLADGRELEAEIVGSDPQTDVAVLRVRGQNLPAVEWGDSSTLQQGELVIAVGNPFGLGGTVTSGMVSAIGRSGVTGSRYENFIQTDASINPGNSGGPLVNLDGKVIGINSAIRSNTGSFAGISFAIPSNLARRVVESVVKTGHVVRGWLGAEGQNLTPALARQFGLSSARGVLVVGIAPGGPASKAGLTRGDVILTAAGLAVQDFAQFDAIVAQTAPGATLRLVVWRDAVELAINVIMGESPSARPGVGMYGNVLDGLRVQELTPQAARRFRVSSELAGVVVAQVVPGTPAEAAGFRAGDVIQGLNRREVRGMREYDAIARAVKPGADVLLYVVRGNEAYFVPLPGE